MTAAAQSRSWQDPASSTVAGPEVMIYKLDVRARSLN